MGVFIGPNVGDAIYEGYKNKVNYLYYLSELNSSNYDDERFKRDFERNFTVKD